MNLASVSNTANETFPKSAEGDELAKNGIRRECFAKSALHFALPDLGIALLPGFWPVVQILSSPLLLMGSSQRVAEQGIAKSRFHWQSQLCQSTSLAFTSDASGNNFS